MATIPSTGSSAAAATSIAAAKTFGSDFSTFLTLLTTQLKNQDPTKAMDTTEMTNQLVAFSQVEQQIAMNTNLQKMISLEQASQVTASQALLGRTVEVESDRLALQNGRAQLVLPAAGTAASVIVTITDNAGRTIRQEQVKLGATESTWSWDGKNSAGVAQQDGAYRFAVAGRDANGEAQTVAAQVRGTVTATERTGSSGDLSLLMGGLSVAYTAVRRVVN
ncbi:flagellar biosynthesis protein FlgD [Siccirubricoccus sp. KC 17139]|uniref:Basal-body rod modification protein FlgD n=1 Tax=Siccirubricoccus soli TaxID=2899147 RepID=A0ABT1DA57_9PROT|nr:flagellar hook capping FlgD N-terminal domain-containing protein [Siccirubricoccus soli]MCO6418824.1 flagellar biosynthesis protein FlgD [Siccirubricoccus soli]MCP2684959.1 flagellar biosynthesis protein FlgD [Siccirubricoccus soli]